MLLADDFLKLWDASLNKLLDQRLVLFWNLTFQEVLLDDEKVVEFRASVAALKVKLAVLTKWWEATAIPRLHEATNAI